MLVWSNVQVGILQYGEVAVHEWSLKNYQTTQEVVEAAKNISRQEGRETRTAYAIHKAWYAAVALKSRFQDWIYSIFLSLLYYKIKVLYNLWASPVD